METRFGLKIFMWLKSTIPKFPLTISVSPVSQFLPQLMCILSSGLWRVSATFKGG